jgi:hypothetical protein
MARLGGGFAGGFAGGDGGFGGAVLVGWLEDEVGGFAAEDAAVALVVEVPLPVHAHAIDDGVGDQGAFIAGECGALPHSSGDFRV